MGMNFDQAVKLAAEIGLTEGVELIAVGRFKVPTDLRATDPWGCSCLVADPVRPTERRNHTVWSVQQWRDLMGDQVQTADEPENLPRRDRKHIAQPSLF